MKTLVYLVLLASLLLVVAVIWPAGSAMAQAEEGGTIRWGVFSNPPSTDPVCHTTFAGGVKGHVYDGFFAFDAGGQTQPQMVREWSLSADGREYNFTLRDGMQFHDGAPVTSADAIASTMRWGESAHAIAREVWDRSQPVHLVVYELTWRMTTGSSFGLWQVYLAFNGAWVQPAGISGVMLPEQCFDSDTQSVGSGPYRFVEWIRDDRVVMDRFEGYLPRAEPQSGAAGGKIAHFDRIESVYVPDPAAQAAGLETGQIHIVNAIPPLSFKAQLQAHPDVTVAPIGRGSPPYLVFNKSAKPFNNRKARQAVLMAADMHAWMTASYGAEGEGEDWSPDHAIFMSDSTWATDVASEKYYKPGGIDLPAAQALMAEALAEEGLTLQDEIQLLAANNIYYMNGGGAYTKQVLESLGLNVHRPDVGWATVFQWKNGGCDLPITPGATAPGGGWNMYHTLAGPFDPLTNEGFSKTWSCGWQNLEIDQLTTHWLAAPTVEEQRALIDQMQVLVYEEVPYIQLGASFTLMAHRKEVQYTPTTGPAPFILTGASFGSAEPPPVFAPPIRPAPIPAMAHWALAALFATAAIVLTWRLRRRPA